MFFWIFSLMPILGFAQGPKDTPSYEHAQGVITLPTLLSIDVTALNGQQMHLSDWSDFHNGKIYSNMCKVGVQGNAPWILSVKADSEYFMPLSPSESPIMPINLLSVKCSGKNVFYPLSTTPTTLIQSENTSIVNNYNLDFKLARAFGYEGGQYYATLIFILSAQ